jgi:Mg-chelatase subunit ChlD
MQSLLDLRYAVNYRYLKSNSPGTVFIAIEMRSLKQPEDSFRISDLSLVVDCSSSMQGKKFKQAKESALDLFELLGDDDYLSVISFEKSARVVLGSGKKSESKSAEQDLIRNLKLGKGTNIYEGLELGFKEISNKLKEEYDNSSSNGCIITRRIVLLTDGQASVGKMEETDFIDLSKRIRERDITVSTIGIGDNYDQQLLHTIAETAGGIPYHVKEVNDLQKIFSEQADELTSTIAISPTFAITMMPGAQIQDIYTVTPTLRKLNVDESNNNNESNNKSNINHYAAKLKDIIVGQRQTIALRVDLPERTSGIYRLARIEVNDLVKNLEVEYTDDHLLYSKETDPYPRMILTCSEATSLVNKGVLVGDHETIRKAETLMSVLSQDKDFERVMTKRPILKKMAATIRGIIERISQGPLTESEKREAIHDTTVIPKKL